jgi:hypothetical protein
MRDRARRTRHRCVLSLLPGPWSSRHLQSALSELQ